MGNNLLSGFHKDGLNVTNKHLLSRWNGIRC